MGRPERVSRLVGLLALVGGVLLVVVPFLVELVVGEFILLLPVALVAAVAALAVLLRRDLPRPGPVAARVSVLALTLAIAAEVYEQTLSGPVPGLVDVLPPAGFVLAGVGLLVAWRSTRTA